MGSSNAENPQQLPKLGPLPPKASDPALLPEPDHAPPKGLEQKKRKRGKKRNNNSEVNGEEAKSNSSNAENPQLFPKLDPLAPKDSNLPMLLEPEPATPKEPGHKKRKGKKRKNNIVVDGEGAESNRSNAENPQLFPELDPLPPKDSDLPLLPEPVPATPKEPEQKKRRKEKRTNNSVADGEGTESSRPNADNPQLLPKLDPLPPKVSNLPLLPEPEPATPKEPEQKRREKRINNSVADGEGAEINRPNAENPQLFPKLDPLPPEDPNRPLLHEPEPATPKEPEQKKRRKGRKRINNSVVDGEGAESNRPNAESPQLFPKLDPLPPKDSNLPLLPEPEPALPKELEQKKRREENRINNSVVNGEGAESNRPNAENPQLFPKLDPLAADDSNLRLLLEPEPALPKEPEQKKRKREKKRKNNSVVDGEGANSNRPNAENHQLFPELDPLPPKDSDLSLYPESEPAPPKEPEQKKRRGKKRKSNSVVDGEGAKSNRSDADNSKLFPEFDPLLPEPESAPLKELDRPKEKKSAVNGEGQLYRPNEEKPQLFSELEPLPPKDLDPSLFPKPEPALAKDPAEPMKKTEEEKRIEAQPKKKTEEEMKIEAQPKKKTEEVKKIEALPKKNTEEEKKIEAQPKKKTEEKKNEAQPRIRTEEEKKIGAQPKKSEEEKKIEAQQKEWSEEEKIEREKSVYLRNNQQICYFCLDIGHSLGECPQSPGVKFPNCLVCNKRGHISTKCPQRSHGIDRKVFQKKERLKESAKSVSNVPRGTLAAAKSVSDVPRETLAAPVRTEENVKNGTIPLSQMINIVLNHGFTKLPQ